MTEYIRNIKDNFDKNIRPNTYYKNQGDLYTNKAADTAEYLTNINFGKSLKTAIDKTKELTDQLQDCETIEIQNTNLKTKIEEYKTKIDKLLIQLKNIQNKQKELDYNLKKKPFPINLHDFPNNIFRKGGKTRKVKRTRRRR